MRTQHIYSFFLLAAVISFSSCEKVIDVKLDSSANQVVIEANVTNDAVQTIKISQSVPYTDSNVYPAVTGAEVRVTDDTGGSWTFFETQPGIYTFGSSFKQRDFSVGLGQPGRTYTLHVSVNDVTYTAMSTMPKPVPLDSLSLDIITFGGDENKQVRIHFKDPEDQVNQYLYIMKINGVQAKSIFVDNDRLTNGNDVSSVLFYFSDNEKLKTGDEVEIEMQSIDKNVFTYWFTLSQQTQNGPGGGVTPGNPPSNISNNALGYFSAHTTETKRLTIE
ncbi:hypothetical protein ADIARSV_1743 [Arcticibacter svalbardensis MN12-7]|uniref:DUF4249 domain-containing protein n=1 Tax=Arcticibacter svalbardensis MN12-7 TaxID=1150600 RepID=R9GTS2_9SPHI|nr:DUF4249 domain-containing protein [Arcticibacter svalbardensis]EOR95083.1 hypothetical protein ADIARSV_1743 [Arcticibacter svalbardensis MN12-7]